MGGGSRSVCIIGAGASGLAALQQCLSHDLDAIVYESRSEIGGAWLLTEPGQCHVEFDEFRVAHATTSSTDDFLLPPTPMYPGLRTNVPTPLMEYRGQPFNRDVGLFPGPERVLQYLQQTASTPQLRQRIHVNRHVKRVRHTRPDDGGQQRRWLVETVDNSMCTNRDATSLSSSSSSSATEQFDCVMFANGHYSKPFIPPITGLDSWPHTITHARWYRQPEPFKHQTVLVVGTGPSGYDATRELAMQLHERRISQPEASDLPKLYQSMRSPSKMGIAFDDPTAPDWASEVTVVPTIEQVKGSSIHLSNGSTLRDVDVILFATGYYFEFPFCHSTDEPWSSAPLVHKPTSQIDNIGSIRPHNLDQRDLFYVPDSTCAVLCTQYLVLPFPLAQLQSRMCSKFWSGECQLSIEQNQHESEPETRQPLVYGHPKQYDKHDEWLKEIGEGQLATEVDYDWRETPQSIRDLRLGAKGLRRSVLGF
ncbi:monooxygenase [Microbotryomycetes sp. JL221]|nr:monooxygenase [Microbotryomycetes sp. JL221]